MDTGRNLVDVLVLFIVEVELGNTIRFSFDRLRVSDSNHVGRERIEPAHTPAKWRLVASIQTALRIPMQSILVVLRDIVVEVVCNTELTVQLSDQRLPCLRPDMLLT